MNKVAFGTPVDRSVCFYRELVGVMTLNIDDFDLSFDVSIDKQYAMVLTDKKTKAHFVMPWLHLLALAADSGFIEGVNAEQVLTANWSES